MKEAEGNIWDHQSAYDAIVITTNGFVKKNGEAVMGKGIALEATQRYPSFPKLLGEHLQQYGNIVGLFEFWDFETGPKLANIFTMPVKPEYGPMGRPGWQAKADIHLILFSLGMLVRLADEKNSQFRKILMPRPGCGNGGLKWEFVKPVIEPYLDDRFTVMNFG